MIDPVWFQAFALTLVVEVPIAALLLARDRRRSFAVLVACAQTFTHPLAWMLFAHEVAGWWSIELAVVVVEAVVYALATRRIAVAFGVALLANACSAAAGLWLLGS